MDFYFKITREEYLDAIKGFLRMRQRSIANLLIFLFMTVGQALLVAWNIVRLSITGGTRAALIAISALICLAQVFYQCSVELRAKSQLRRSMEKGKISEEFWGRQHLSLKDEVLRLHCGKVDLKYDCAYYDGAQLVGGMLVVSFRRGKDVHQLLIPASAFASDERRQEFEAALAAAKRASILAGYAEAAKPRPNAPAYSADFDYTADGFARDYVRAARLAYSTAVPYDLMMITKLAAAAFLVYNIIAGHIAGAMFTAFAVFVIIILLYPVLFTFTPFIRQVAKRNTQSLFGGLASAHCAVDVTDEKLIFSGDTFYNQIPLASVYGAEKRRDFAAVYLKDNTAVVMKVTPENEHEVTRMTLYLDTLGASNRKGRFRRTRRDDG